MADDELTRAMGLVTRDQYDDLFKRYLDHVSHAGRKEKIYNQVTGAFEEADYKFMEEMEKHFQVEKSADVLRSEVLGRIGAASQTKELEELNYRMLFPNLFQKLEDSYYGAQKETIVKMANDLLHVLSGEKDNLSTADRSRAEETLEHLKTEFGYCEASAKEVVSTLVSEVYRP